MIYDFEKLTFQIFSAGIFKHREGRYFVKSRPYAAFACRLSGTGKFKIGDKEFVTEPGDIYFIAEGVDYDVVYSGGESAVVHFCECNYTESECIKIKNSGIFCSMFSEMCEYEGKIKNFNYIKSLVYSILHLISESLAPNIRDEAFKNCLAYIDENYCNCDLTMEKICSSGNISTATLRRKFHLYCQMSPKQYILEKRLGKTVKLLIEGEKTIGETARCCGFEDEKYASRLVRKRFGIPPSEFKKMRL